MSMRSTLKSRRSVLGLLLAVPVWGQLQAPQVIILIGPPGSGKTVQASYLSKRLKIPPISMQALLQQEVGKKTPLAKALAPAVASGELVTDGPANELMNARLLRADAARGFILDGYPASAGQAKALDTFLQERGLQKPVVVIVDAPDDVLRQRMTRRRRADDNPENIDRRITEYRSMGRLVEQWYGAQNALHVSGSGTPAEVAARIANQMESAAANQTLKRRTPQEQTLQQRPSAPMK